MKKDNLPQQPAPIYNGETKGIYVLDKDGNYVLAQTSGWEVETTALEEALGEIERLTADALLRARAGQTSPLEYHMYVQRMDLPMLAKATGRFQWQVRRHFRPAAFTRLSARQLESYARALDIDVDTLRRLPE
ncbi:MAG: hypothetical protein P8X48_02420 [Acidiferrobacteraceae bacterium]|jgi:hypothetical protein